MRKLLLILLLITAFACNSSQQDCMESMQKVTIRAAKAYNQCIKLFSAVEETELNAAFSLKLADW